ncbi:restriction endonuclease [Candidatus Woesearchaeota archaeon]|nr:restriction endonuclease [Candidatus Woesearchaeota archaeon]
MDDTAVCCLSCVGIIISIVWLIANPPSFIFFLVVGIIIYFIYKNNHDKKVKLEQEEKEKREKDKLGRELAFEKKQNAKGLYKFENKWGTKKQIEKWKEAKYGIDKNFQQLSPFEFEEFIAKLFRKMGYKAHATKKTGDYGIDVIAEKDGKKIAIQCKQNQLGNNVGNVTVQNTLGSMWKIKADQSIIITTSNFTKQAEEQAKEAPVELWDNKYLKKMVRKYFIELDDDNTKNLQDKLDEMEVETKDKQEVVAKVGIKKESGYSYFVDDKGNISRKKGDNKEQVVAKVGIKKEEGYYYFVNEVGDVARRME